MKNEQLDAVFSHFQVEDLDAKIEDQIRIINKFTENNQNALKAYKLTETEGLKLKKLNNELEHQNIDCHKNIVKTDVAIGQLSKSIKTHIADLGITEEIKIEDSNIFEKAQGIMEEKYLTKIK